MITVSRDQSILEVARLLLQNPGQELCWRDEVDQREHRINRKNILTLLASGYPVDYDLQSTERTISPQFLSEESDAPPTSMTMVMRWFISVFESLHDGVLIMDHNEIVRYINRSFDMASEVDITSDAYFIFESTGPSTK